MQHFRLVLLVAISTLLVGCANQTSIRRNESAAGHVLGMDAQQRVVISAAQTHTESDKGGTVTTGWVKYCPEPSPDAIASFAASLSAGITSGDKQASLQNALATSVAAVGLRTPTTQVIRDLITAACIADLNKAFASAPYRDAFARNQQFVLAAHAIAVLGGDTVAGQPAVSGSASRGGGADAAAMFGQYQKAQAARQKAETALAAARLDAPKAADDVKTAQDALDAKKKETAPKAEEVKALLDALDAKKAVQRQKDADVLAYTSLLADTRAIEAAAAKALAAVGDSTPMSASGSAIPGTVSFSAKSGPSDKAVDAIERITRQVLSSGFTLDKCLDEMESIEKSKTLSPESKTRLFEGVVSMCTSAIEAKRQLNQLLMIQ